MKISDLRLYRSNKKYKLTPLFWKLSVSAAILASVLILFNVFHVPAPSVSVASASDSTKTVQQTKTQQTKAAQDTPALPDEQAQASEEETADAEKSVQKQGASDVKATGGAATGKESADTPAKPEKEAASSQPPAIDTAAAAGSFASAAFIGDSRTEGLLLYSGVKGATDYAIKGLNLKSVFSNAFVTGASGGKSTILKDMQNKSFDRIYISFGLNELGWNSDTYAQKYAQLVTDIRAIQPNAAIYLQSTFPINPDKCKFDQNTNKRITEMNAQIAQIASQTSNVHYLDLYAQFKDSRGYLVLDASSDGIHLNKKYCVYWLKCLENNADGAAIPPSPVQAAAGPQQPETDGLQSEADDTSKESVSPSPEAIDPIETGSQSAPENNETAGNNLETE